jgi:hypothetical protein
LTKLIKFFCFFLFTKRRLFIIRLGPRRDHQERNARARAAAAIHRAGAGNAFKRRAGAAVAGPIELVRHRVERRVGRRREGMVVPAVGVVVGDDDGGVVPIRLDLDEVDQLDDAGLLVERIGIAGMAVLVGGQLDVGDRREVARD